MTVTTSHASSMTTTFRHRLLGIGDAGISCRRVATSVRLQQQQLPSHCAGHQSLHPAAVRTHHYTHRLSSCLSHTHTFNGPFPALPGWACTRKVKPIWILLKQETVSGSGISWAVCKFAPCSRQTTTPAPHHSDFYRPDALSAAQPTDSKH